MKNKAPLALIEQLIMLLILAVAAAVCLRVFLWADRQADENSRLDGALQQVQNTAEVLKSTSGDLDAAAKIVGGSLQDGLWLQQHPDYTVKVIPTESGTALLGMARVIAEVDGTPITELTVCYQEVAP